VIRMTRERRDHGRKRERERKSRINDSALSDSVQMQSKTREKERVKGRESVRERENQEAGNAHNHPENGRYHKCHYPSKPSTAKRNNNYRMTMMNLGQSCLTEDSAIPVCLRLLRRMLTFQMQLHVFIIIRSLAMCSQNVIPVD